MNFGPEKGVWKRVFLVEAQNSIEAIEKVLKRYRYNETYTHEALDMNSALFKEWESKVFPWAATTEVKNFGEE